MVDQYDLWAEYYDLIHADVTDDIGFYVEESSRSIQPVLEIGCGTGRVMIPVARAGIKVFGIDISGKMLEVCRKKIATEPREVRDRTILIREDMRSFDLSERFGLIYLPLRTFLQMHTVEDQVAALRNFHQHLLDGGILALNFFNANVVSIGMGLRDFYGVPRKMGEYDSAENGKRIILWYVSSYNQVMQIANHHVIFEEISKDGETIGRKHFDLKVRWTYRYEFEHLLNRCGFLLEKLYGTFDRQLYSNPKQELIWLARKV